MTDTEENPETSKDLVDKEENAETSQELFTPDDDDEVEAPPAPEENENKEEGAEEEPPPAEDEVQEAPPEGNCKIKPGQGPKISNEEKMYPGFVPSENTPEQARAGLMKAVPACSVSSKESLLPPDNDSLKSSKQWNNPIKGEMHYYLSTLRLSVPKMTNEEDKTRCRSWTFYLLKNVNDKLARNRYLLLVTMSSLCDECIGLIKEEPPSGPQACLPAFATPPQISQAKWETDMYWDRFVTDIDVHDSWTKCSLHDSCLPNGGLEEDVLEAVCGHLLDQEFKYLLFLIRPYIPKIKNPEEKTRISMWVLRLAAIKQCSCVYMKGMRNDYMQALLGYISVGLSPGPFKRLPADETLTPFAKEIKKSCKATAMPELKREIAENFLSSQKPLKNGAMCYVAISGSSKKNQVQFSPLNIDF